MTTPLRDQLDALIRKQIKINSGLVTEMKLGIIKHRVSSHKTRRALDCRLCNLFDIRRDVKGEFELASPSFWVSDTVVRSVESVVVNEERVGTTRMK